MDIVSSVVTVIQMLVKYAPQASKAFKAVKTFVKGLMGAGVITKEEQDQLMAYVKEVLAAHEAGKPPPAWTVEPDPE